MKHESESKRLLPLIAGEFLDYHEDLLLAHSPITLKEKFASL
jgi:hypothetical protein